MQKIHAKLKGMDIITSNTTKEQTNIYKFTHKFAWKYLPVKNSNTFCAISAIPDEPEYMGKLSKFSSFFFVLTD